MTTPSIATVQPSSGSVAGGTPVTIFGFNFNNPAVTAVTFGGVAVSSFTILNFSEITTVTPPNPAGAVTVAVTNASGTGSRANAFTYSTTFPPTISLLNPNNGSIAGGYTCTITGTGFSQGVNNVNFGGTHATNVFVANDTSLTCTVPPGAVGTVNVTVIGPGGLSGALPFTYTNTPPPPPPPPPAVRSNTYIIERMDNRIWPTVEDCWCVDCGFSLPRPMPAADLVASSAFGAGILIGVTNLIGGQNYSSATTISVVDGNGLGPGTGAIATPTIVGGVITAVAFSAGGQNYVFPNLVFNDPENTGSGASATVVMDNSTSFSASAAVFSSGNVGSFIRAGYGVAKITAFLSSTTVTANMLSPIVQVQPDDPINTAEPVKFVNGTWTMTAPITQLYLPQLVGFEVTGLADGQVIPPTVVPANGFITLANPASAIVVGLAFQAQLQTTYLDAGEPTVQGQRKKIAEATARIEQSAAFQIGSNQPDGSVQSPQELFTLWQNMAAAPTHAVPPYNAPFTPLFTGDVRIPILGGFNTRGQVALQQLNPLPLQVLDVVPEVLGGDEPNQKFPRMAAKRNGGQGQQ